MALIYTVRYCTSLYVSTDLYCTLRNNTVRFYWHALYSTEQRCSFDWLVLYSTESYCTGNWHALYTTEQYRTGILTHIVHNCTALNGDTDTHCTLLCSSQHIIIKFCFIFFIFLLNQIYFNYRARLIKLTKFSSLLLYFLKIKWFTLFTTFFGGMTLDCFLDYRNYLQRINKNLKKNSAYKSYHLSKYSVHYRTLNKIFFYNSFVILQ